MTPREQLIAWLADAHAMERGVAEILKCHAVEAKDFPGTRASIEDHLSGTEAHAEKVVRCLRQLDAEPHTLAPGIARFRTLLPNLPSAFAEDLLLRNTLAECAIEHFEIACYSSLITAASVLGEEEIAITCERILEDEKEMAELLESQLEEMTINYLEKLGAE